MDLPPPSNLNNFEDFEAAFTTWVETGGDDNNCWKRDSAGTPTGNTGPSTGAVATTWYVFYESSNGCSPGTGQQAFLLGPTIDFDAFNNVQVIFWRHMWDGGLGQMGNLALQLEDNTGSGTFTEVWSDGGNQGNQWDQITVDLSAADIVGGQRQLRFVATEVVDEVMQGKFPNSVLVLGGCSTLSNPSLANSLMNRGASSIVGWDNLIGSRDNDTIILAFLENHLINNMEIQDAVESAMEKASMSPKNKANFVFTDQNNYTKNS